MSVNVILEIVGAEGPSGGGDENTLEVTPLPIALIALIATEDIPLSVNPDITIGLAVPRAIHSPPFILD
jgi:hypothetical protein